MVMCFSVSLKVLANVIHLGVPAKLSDATVLSGFEMCLQFIFSRRGSELLRKETEDALMRIARDICSKNFTDEGEDVDYVQPEDIKSLLRESREENSTRKKKWIRGRRRKTRSIPLKKNGVTECT